MPCCRANYSKRILPRKIPRKSRHRQQNKRNLLRNNHPRHEPAKNTHRTPSTPQKDLTTMDIDILEQTPISLPTLKGTLETLKTKNKELNFRAQKVLDYLTESTTLDAQQAEDLKKKLIEANIPRIKEKHIDKIIDLTPDSIDEIKSLLIGENVTLKPEDLQKILTLIKG